MAKKIKDTVSDSIEQIVELTEEAAKFAAEKAPAAKEAVKKSVEKVPGGKSALEKAPAAKAAAKKAATKAKKVVKDITPVQETFFEINGEQIMAEEIVAKIKEAYKAEGHRIAYIKTLRTYVNVAERKAYYVINDTPEDKYIEF